MLALIAIVYLARFFRLMRFVRPSEITGILCNAGKESKDVLTGNPELLLTDASGRTQGSALAF
ncbi:hypothetical protein [Rhizobium sp. RM]|jgi:hypothetical protein|uniref:hypothetical protein n=1 Tax=Rhizobium sp. RM TaxID=2748079 RepID=UPI0015B6D52A|nr:hypothetical protein [Rhizobium sp. RM]NWJ24323.1 hypothetical protein [Rhizobium sp. RM]